jgi:hypothetical protein
VHEDVVQRIHPAGDHQVAAAGSQLQQREVQRGKRTGAGGVHRAVGPAQIESVADSAGHDVTQQAREGTLLPGYIGVRDVLDDPLAAFIIDAGFLQRSPPFGEPEPGAQRNDQLLSTSNPQDDAGVPGFDRQFCVPQRLLGCGERQQLRCIGCLQGGGRNAEFRGVEVDGR